MRTTIFFFILLNNEQVNDGKPLPALDKRLRYIISIIIIIINLSANLSDS